MPTDTVFLSHPDTAAPSALLRGNADVDWDVFDSESYFEHNYRLMLPEDAKIVTLVADHFQRNRSGRLGRAIDCGSGTNLYPALTMLPMAAEIVLYERASSNRDWLASQLARPADSWLPFWHQMSAGRDEYDRIGHPLDVLSERARVTKGNVFALRPEQYHLGTMFFVAESITSRKDEFCRATRHFVNSLVRHAPFAAAFMRNSSGYFVGEGSFPACSVDERDVLGCLEDVAFVDNLSVVGSDRLRDGYSGMIVATGRRR